MGKGPGSLGKNLLFGVPGMVLPSAGVAKRSKAQDCGSCTRGFESHPRSQTGIDYSPEAVAAAEEWIERDRQWMKIRALFIKHGKWWH